MHVRCSARNSAHTIRFVTAMTGMIVASWIPTDYQLGSFFH